MSKCLNLSDKNVSRMVKDFGELNVSQLVDTYFGDNVPTYDEFINNKNVKEQLGIIPISKTKDILGSTFPKEIDNDRMIRLKKAISRINNKNFNAGVPENYRLINYKRIGQSENYTWGIRKVTGVLDVEAKLERAKSKLGDYSEDRTTISDLEKMIENDEYMLPEEDIEIDQEEFDYENEAREIQRQDAERAGLDYTDDYLKDEVERTPVIPAIPVLFNKLKDKLQRLYPAIGLNISAEPLWEKGAQILNQQDYNNEVAFRIKTVDLLTSRKADEVFAKGLKNKWPLDKMLTELQVPKLQKQLIDEVLKDMIYFDSIPFNAQIAYAIASTYNYTVEINTAKKINRELEDGVYIDGSLYFTKGFLVFTEDREGNVYEVEDSEIIAKVKASQSESINSNYYSNLTVPGGTNYTEQEIATPGITPSIKGHAQFATDKGIGWFRSDEQFITSKDYPSSFKGNYGDTWEKRNNIWYAIDSDGITHKRDDLTDTDVYAIYDNQYGNINYLQKGENTKTRRILEVQSDLFQKGRDREELTKTEYIVTQDVGNEVIEYLSTKEDFKAKPENNVKGNQFLQLLNKDNNWVNFFTKSIIQDSAKKGYEKVLFPSGDTASKVEGHTTLEQFKKEKEDRIKELEKGMDDYNYELSPNNYFEENGKYYWEDIEASQFGEEPVKEITKEIYDKGKKGELQREATKREINQLKQELERVEGPEGFGALRPIYNFYENTMSNVLKKQGYQPKLVTDEYGNTWNEVTIDQTRDLQNVLLQKNEADRIIGQANIQAMSVLIDAMNKKEDTLPHEYAHHYIAWFRNTPLVQEGILKWGSEEALVQSIGEQVVAQKGEAYGWWKKFTEWVMSIFDNLSTKDKQELTNILTDAFLQAVDLQTGKVGISAERSRELAAQASGIFNQTLENPFDESIENIPVEFDQEAVDRALDAKIEAQRQLDLQEEVDETEPTSSDPAQEKAKNIAIEFAKKLAGATSMDYKLVSEAEAQALLAGTPTPYGGQPGFFHANTIYLVNGRLSLDTVLHEFAHPIVKGILKQNPALFNKLYAALEATPEGQDIIAQIQAEYPNLEKGSDRFKEEALVTALEVKAVSKVNSESPFGKFIKNLMFAVKKVLRSMFTGKTATTVNLNKLSEKTTLSEIADMLASPEFMIEDLDIIASDTAEFRNEITDRIEELKNVPKDKLQETIDRLYADTLLQLNTLKQAPFKVKEELLKANGTKILNYIKEELEKYQTVNIKAQDVDPQNVLNAIADHESEMRLRSLALINSLNELKVFADGVGSILTDIQNSKDRNTNANISKVVYYKGFLKNQSKLLADLKKIPGLDSDGEFFKKLNNINDKIIKANDQIKDIEFNFISTFFKDQTDLMAGEVEKHFRERVSLIMKAEGIEEADIEKFVQKVINNPDGKSMTVKDIELPLSPRRAKYVVDAAKEYFFKRLGRDQIEEYLRGEREDLGYFTAWITPYSNMDDPLTGGFVTFIKEKMNDAMIKSQNEANDITIKLLPLLNAVGYNPRKVDQLGDMLMFTDKVGYTNNEGVFEEKDVLTYINKFKNYRADRARLQHDFDQAKSKKDSVKMKEAYEALELFDEKYMHRKFTKEYYDIQKIWKTGAKVTNPFTGEEITVGPAAAFDAFLERQAGLDKINTLKNVHFLELEDLYELGDSEQQAKLEYNRLFDIYGLDGKPKQGEELERVLLRKKQRELSRNMYDYPVDLDRIQKDLDNFDQKLRINRNLDPDAEPAEGETMNQYQKEMQRFFRKNLKTAYTSNYYKSRQQIFEDIRKITEKAGVKSKVALELSELYKERYRLANSTSDANGQPNGLNFTPEQIDLLRDIENKILDLENSFDKKTGLTKEEKARLNSYIVKASKNIPLTPEEKTDYFDLYKVKNEMGLTPLELQALKSKFKELSEISIKEPTDYYIEAFNYAIRNTGLPEITVENADAWINSDHLTQALASSKEFAQWFTRNHYEKQSWDPAKGNYVKNLRLNVWTITKPSNEDAYQTTTLIDPVTKEPIIKQGIPAGKYSRSVIKNEFLTIPRGANWENYIGTFIDNKGNYLPRDYKPGDRNSAYDNTYINEKYVEMEKENSAEFKLLKTMSEEFVKLQNGKPIASRLYLDSPRFRRRSNLEYVMSGESKDNFFSKIGSFKDIWNTWFGKAPDDVDYGFNFDASQILVSTDLEGSPVSKIPVRGTYNLDANLVSKDVLRNMYEYLLSLNEQQILLENEPVADALLSVLANNPNKNMESLDRNEFKLTGKKKFIKSDTNNREEALKYLVDKVFYGKSNSSFEVNNPGVTKIVQGMFKKSARAFMAFDPQSAIKNRWGMLYQNAVFAAGGRYVTPTSLAKGKLKAKETAMYWVFKDIYEKGMKTQDVQLIERFDPALRTEQDFGRSSSRSIAKDLSDLTYAYDFRKTAELEATMELFWGMMYNKYVDQIQPDGSKVSIPYAEAWTTDDQGRLTLKKGIDPNYGFDEVTHIFTAGETLASIAQKYGISEEALKGRSGIESDTELKPGMELQVGNASEFKRMKFLAQGVSKKITGSMDKFDTPQAEKMLVYRAFTFFKRFATGMFLEKYQFDTTKGNRGGYVYNWDTMTLEKGYYITTFQNVMKLLRTLGKDWPLMTKQEKAALAKVLAEGLLLFLLAMIVGSWVFDYDPEEEDRFDKIKERNKTWSGYFGNHLLYLLMATKSENEAFVPFLGFGDMANYFKTTTIASANTIDLYIKIMWDLYYMATGNKDALIGGTQDIGPYRWQDAGDYKLWNHIGSMYGIKGKNRDALWAIKKFETYERNN